MNSLCYVKHTRKKKKNETFGYPKIFYPLMTHAKYMSNYPKMMECFCNSYTWAVFFYVCDNKNRAETPSKLKYASSFIFTYYMYIQIQPLYVIGFTCITCITNWLKEGKK